MRFKDLAAFIFDLDNRLNINFIRGTYVPRARILNVSSSSILRRGPQCICLPAKQFKQITTLQTATKSRSATASTMMNAVSQIEPVRTKLNLSNPENVLRTSGNQHNFVFVGVPRMKGKCVTCLKKGKVNLERLTTCCDTCAGSNWMCEPCFEELHD